MNREELERFIESRYGVGGERLFHRYPTFRVYRHGHNRKWFAVLMDISGKKIGLGEGIVSVVNLKCHRDMTDYLWQEAGIFPAYHMNKEHWITCLLDGSVPSERVVGLLASSFLLTGGYQ
ncbi:MAG: MmcQ/YjbR family DNA-binding protein [Clostridia bacterium]|nr:MmcQ/YjbR family DNA-binding protein [Clostridia bacterium]